MTLHVTFESKPDIIKKKAKVEVARVKIYLVSR